MKYISQIFNIALRELDILRRNRIYGFCMIVFPLLLVVFFTTMLDDGTALDLPVGVVDQDNSATSRGLVRNLDAMQSSRVVYRRILWFSAPSAGSAHGRWSAAGGW